MKPNQTKPKKSFKKKKEFSSPTNFYSKNVQTPVTLLRSLLD